MSDDLPELDPVALAAWLRSVPPDRECGRRRSPTRCPLATYLTASVGDECAVMTECYQGPLRAHGRTAERDLPAWAMRFVRNLDAGSSISRTVTARQALAALEVALEEVQPAD